MRPTDRLPFRAVTVLAAALSLSASAGAALAAPETLSIDTSHTRAGFSIRHLFTQVRGEFKTTTGTITVDPADLNATKVNVEIDATSINTNNDRRDTDLRSDNFFDVEKFPKLTFVSKSVNIKDNKGTMTGDLTMHGVTKPVTLDVEVGGFGKMSKGTVAGFNATGKLDRKDFGILWNRTLDQGGTLLGDDVALEINVEARTPMPAPPPKAADAAVSK